MKIKKKQKPQKKERKLKFQDYKNCLEAVQIENKINCFKKNKIQVDSIKEDQKYFVKDNKLMLKIQRRFKSERHNVFPKEVNKIGLSSNVDK